MIKLIFLIMQIIVATFFAVVFLALGYGLLCMLIIIPCWFFLAVVSSIEAVWSWLKEIKI